MAKLPRGRAHHLTLALVVALATSSPAGGAAEMKRVSVALVGTWHLLIHYTDDHAHNPEQMRWDDKVWVFEPSGRRLRWKEYPIVVFEDSAGRFENLGGGRASRVLQGWEPNEAQLAQIRAGLEVNNRGMKSKMLRKSGDAWRSTTRPTAASASIVTYVELWSIEDAAGRPAFRREDVLESARAENLEGVTQYTTTEVAAAGDVLRGRFERDGTCHGTFRLMRAGTTGQVKGSGKTEGQRFYEMFPGEFDAAMMQGGGDALKEVVEQRVKGGGEILEGVRAQVRNEIRDVIEEQVRSSGRDPREYEREVDSLTAKIASRILEEGKSLEEVDQMLQRGEIQP